MHSHAYHRTLIGAAAAALLVTAPLAIAGETPRDCSGPTCSGGCAAVVDTAAQERLGELVNRQRDELVSLTRTLALERKRQTRLESELAAARASEAPAPVAQARRVEANSLEEENRRLRLLLDVEREERERLAGKLRAAERIADMVFRAEERPPPAAEAEVPARALPRWQAPEEPSPENSTVWTREAMGL